jgi:hypothetical protein
VIQSEQLNMKTKRQNVTYSSIYNELYKKIHKDQTHNAMKTIIKTLINDTDIYKNSRSLFWITKHLIKIHNTQQIGKHITREEFYNLEEINRLSSISNNLKLRSIQQKSIEYLYRPNGNLFNILKDSFEENAYSA